MTIQTEEVTTPEQAAPSPSTGKKNVLRSGPAQSIMWNFVSLLVFLVLWQILATAMDSRFLPGPIEVIQAFSNIVAHGDVTRTSLWAHVLASTQRVLVGFFLGALIGAPMGILMGLYPKLWDATRGVLEPLRFIPPIAWIPIAIVILTGMTRFGFLIFLGTFFPVLIGSLTAVARVENLHLDVAKVCGASRLWTIRHVVIPTVLPEVMASMRVGLGIGWMTIVAAEMAGGSPLGLGKFMINYAELLRIPEIIVGMIIIGLLGSVLNEILLVLERWLFKWRWKVSL